MISQDFRSLELKRKMGYHLKKNQKPSVNIIKTQNATKDTDAKLHEVTHDLIERIKELNCLYGISRLVENKDISLNDILQGIVDLIPPAYQYPEVTCACINLRDKKYLTPNYQETNWKQIEPIVIDAKQVGTLEVYYLEDKPFCFEGPFLKEERDLVHGIAERLGQIIESKNAEITLKKLYLREKRLHRKLQLEMKNRIEFTRLLIHELKSPLTSLMATSQLLSEETRNTRLEKLSQYVCDGANILNNRIDELHDVIKGEIGKLNLELKPLNLQKFLTSLIDETRPFCQQQQVSLQLKVKDNPLPDVYADEQRVRQIMLNLINNGCKYASEGKLIIIKVEKDISIKSIKIEVRDFGPGISKDKERMIFKSGYQLSHENEQKGGLGIGLPLCKVLVELHGGSIWLESTVGKGSSFFFTLPLSEHV